MKIRILQRRESRLGQSKPWRFLQRFFLIAGLFAMGVSVSVYGACYLYQMYEGWRFDSALPHNHAAPSDARNHAEIPQRTAARRSLIGRITIPRLGISAMVREGVDGRTLGLAVGHIPSTALPGEMGNVGVAAHRDNLFRNLKGVARDDEITLATLESIYVYRVVSFGVVDPEEVSVLAPSAGERTLTLVTCYPFYFVGHAPKRFIVRARQVESTPAAIEAPVNAFEGRSQPVYESVSSGSPGARNPVSREERQGDHI